MGVFQLGGICNCCGGTTICVTVCSAPAIPLAGATIQIWTTGGGSTLVAACTTNSGGCCSFSQTGSYIVKVVYGGVTHSEGTKTLSGGTITIALGGTLNPQIICCGGYAIPASLTLTDAVATTAFTYQAGVSGTFPTWIGCTSPSVLSVAVTTPGGVCVAAAPATQPIAVCYQMQCMSGSSPVFTLQRAWGWVFEQGTLTPIYYSANNISDPCTFSGMPSFCAPAPPASCGSPHVDTSTGTANPTTSTPFTISFSPTPALGNFTSDPVGGTVAVSA